MPNVCKTESFIFKTTSSGVYVFDDMAEYLGFVNVNNATASYATKNNLYISTSSSGILSSPLSAISGSVFDTLLSYKTVPNITDNNVYYIHGSENYLVATTASGVDHYNLLTDARIYNESAEYEMSKCFQTAAGRFYYISAKETAASFAAYGEYKTRIRLNRPTNRVDFQIRITLTSSNFDYTKVTETGSDILFFDENFNSLPFYIEDWNYEGTSIIWVKVTTPGTEMFYLISGDTELVPQSSAEDTFDFYDDFTTFVASGTKWAIVSDPAKFLVKNNERLVCSYGNYDYIQTHNIIPFPCVVEQYINKIDVSGADNEIGYENILVPNADGFSWYYGGNQTFEFYNAGNSTTEFYYDKFFPNIDGVLTTTISHGLVKLKFESTSVNFDDSFALDNTNDAANRALRIFGGGPSFEVEVVWIRVRKYDSCMFIATPDDPDIVHKQFYLNVVYDNNSNWTDTTVGHTYIIDSGVTVYDVFVTEGTSLYSVSDNVLFLATSDGVKVIEERQGAEENSRVKTLKVDNNNEYYS